MKQRTLKVTKRVTNRVYFGFGSLGGMDSRKARLEVKDRDIIAV